LEVVLTTMICQSGPTTWQYHEKNIIRNFEDTQLKNNIMTELTEIYSETNNYKRNFVKTLDTNNTLIGFNIK
jgi:hypothetical protein